MAILYQNVLDCLRDTDLPVKVQAALALQPMIRHESGKFVNSSEIISTIMALKGYLYKINSPFFF